TMASRGRSTKMADSMDSAPAECLRQRTCSDRHAWAHALQSFDDNLFATLQPFIDHDARADLATDLNSPNRGLAVVDHEDVDTFLIGDQGRLRNDHLFFRL